MNDAPWKKHLATAWFTGYLPIGPGSWGTFPGMLLCWIMQPLYLAHWSFYLCVIVFLTFIGVDLATSAERQIGKKDPGCVVIDEIVVFPLTMFLIPISWGTMLLGFFLNRLMDTTKLPPCHKIQELPGGWGIMLDDLIAAIYSCLLMHICLHFWPQIVTWRPPFL